MHMNACVEHGHFIWQRSGKKLHISLQYRYNQTGGDVIEVDVNHKTCFMKSVSAKRDWTSKTEARLFVFY